MKRNKDFDYSNALTNKSQLRKWKQKCEAYIYYINSAIQICVCLFNGGVYELLYNCSTDYAIS